jgi:hypothetical protein
MIVLFRRSNEPPFLQEGAPSSSAMPDGRLVYYSPRFFRILDAIEYDVGRAESFEEIATVFYFYFRDITGFPEVFPATWVTEDGRTIRFRPVFREGMAARQTYWLAWESNPDHDGTARLEVFASAMKRRLAEIQEAARRRTISEMEEAVLGPEGRRQGPCHEREIPRKKGGAETARHNRYADFVTGSSTEYRIETPEGIRCDTDGKDSRDPWLLWEVKTRHDWVSSPPMDAPYFGGPGGRVAKLEEQRRRCVVAAARCGYKYMWAFESAEAAEVLARDWRGVPPIVHRAWRDNTK